MSPRSASRDADELRLETSEDARKRKMKEIDRTRTSRRPEYAIDSNGTHYYVRIAVTNTFLRRFSLHKHVKRKVRYDVSEAARRLVTKLCSQWKAAPERQGSTFRSEKAT